MNERERLMAVLRGEPSDVLPWYADLSYLYYSMEYRGTLEERFRGTDGYLRFYRDMGAGICFYAPFVWRQEFEDGITEMVEEADGLKILTIRTPKGWVREVQRYMPVACTWAIVEHYVKTVEDLRVMLYAMEHRRIVPNEGEYKSLDDSWGGDGCAVCLAPISAAPIQRMLTRWAGVSVTMDLYMDCRDELEGIFSALEEADTPLFNRLCTSPCIVVEFPENLSAEITGRRFFERYNMPYYQRRIEALHAAGKKVGIHNDGTLRGTFDLLGRCGFDFVEAVTPAPAGDVPLEDLRREVGCDIVIWGGLPGAMFSPCYSDEQFEAHLAEAVRLFREDGRCVLGVADQVPPDGLVARVKRVREVVGI